MKSAFLLGVMALNQTLAGFSGVYEPTGSIPYGLYLIQDSAQQAPSDIQLQRAVTQAM